MSSPLTNLRPSACLALALLAACGADSTSLQSADGKIRLLSEIDVNGERDRAQSETAAALRRFEHMDLIYAHTDAMAVGAARACRDAGIEDVAIVGVGGLPEEGRAWVAEGLLDATFEIPRGAAEAIDIGLLAVSGIPPGHEILLGTRLWTEANRRAGGQPFVAPGDVVLAGLRRMHADVLTTEPKTDVVFRFGMALPDTEEPRYAVLRAEARAAAQRYPQIDFHCDDMAGETTDAVVRGYIAQNFNCILIVSADPSALAGARRDAIAAGVRVLVIGTKPNDDDYTCFIGGDDAQIGKQAGRHAKALLGDAGGTILELTGRSASRVTRERHRGFVEALGLRRP